MARENFTMPSSRGDEKLNCYRWMPEGNPKASLQIVHGMTEHILRYEDFATFLNSNGFAVYGHDHLGHGGTSEEKGFIAEDHGDDMLVEDMRRVNDRMRSDLPGIPHFVMGHSMGSFVTRRFLTIGGDDIDAAVIMGTGQQASYKVTLALTIAKLLCMVKGNHYRSGLLNNLVFGSYDKKFDSPDLPNKWLCANPESLKAYDADPDCGFRFTDAAYRDLFTLIRRVEREEGFGNIPKDLPVLFVSGQDDPVGDFGKGVEKAKAALEGRGLKPDMILYPGMRHEILNETDHEKVYSDILGWITALV